MVNKRTFQELAAVFNDLHLKTGMSNNKNLLIRKTKTLSKNPQKLYKFYKSRHQVFHIENLCTLYHLTAHLFLF